MPNLLRNGVLARLLDDYPRLNWLLVHNIDTLGANIEPGILGSVIESGATLSFEVIPRRIDDRGGGLAKVGGRLRLLEGLAQPREDTEFKLRYYNTLTTWVRVDGLLDAFGLSREDLRRDPERVAAAVRGMAARVPTYVTIKDVKRRWGHGQEDVYPVAQFEKLWGDLSSLPELNSSFLVVDRRRGQQLKDAAQLDGWANDGSMAACRVALPFHAIGGRQWPRAIGSWSRAARASSAPTWWRPCWPRATPCASSTTWPRAIGRTWPASRAVTSGSRATCATRASAAGRRPTWPMSSTRRRSPASPAR